MCFASLQPQPDPILPRILFLLQFLQLPGMVPGGFLLSRSMWQCYLAGPDFSNSSALFVNFPIWKKKHLLFQNWPILRLIPLVLRFFFLKVNASLFFCLLFFLTFYFYFILLYNTVLVLPYIDMNPPRVYMRSRSLNFNKDWSSWNTAVSLIQNV